jgi:hypothetical protein
LKLPTPEKNNGREHGRVAGAAALLVLRLARFLEKRRIGVKYEGEDKDWQARFLSKHKNKRKRDTDMRQRTKTEPERNEEKAQEKDRIRIESTDMALRLHLVGC